MIREQHWQQSSMPDPCVVCITLTSAHIIFMSYVLLSLLWWEGSSERRVGLKGMLKKSNLQTLWGGRRHSLGKWSQQRPGLRFRSCDQRKRVQTSTWLNVNLGVMGDGASGGSGVRLRGGSHSGSGRWTSSYNHLGRCLGDNDQIEVCMKSSNVSVV